MNEVKEEKRKFNRVPFSYNDEIIGSFIGPDGREKFKAHILNFSIQGLYFTLKKDEKMLKYSSSILKWRSDAYLIMMSCCTWDTDASF